MFCWLLMLHMPVAHPGQDRADPDGHKVGEVITIGEGPFDDIFCCAKVMFVEAKKQISACKKTAAGQTEPWR